MSPVDRFVRKILKPKYSTFYLVSIPLSKLSGLSQEEMAKIIADATARHGELLHYSYENNKLVLRFDHD